MDSNKPNTTVEPASETEKSNFAAMQFAKMLAQQTIHDPTGNTSRRKNRSYSTYTRETIEEYLSSPTSNEKALRDASIYMYQTNGRYRNLLQYNANIPCWIYVVNSLNFDPAKVTPDNFRKQYFKTSGVLESMGVIKTMRDCALVALREGVFFGVIWGGDGKSFIMQKLDPDNCTITSVSDGNVFQFVYDMSKVSEGDLETHYPPKFKDMYQEYRRTGNQYQLVPPEISVCLKADPTIPEYSIPPYSAVLPGLYTIDNVEDLFETASELSVYKLLSGTLPVDDDGVPLIDYQTMMQYYSHVAANVGDRVGVAFSPFELKSFDFEQSGAATQIDTVGRATENFFSAAGTPAILHGASNSNSGVTKLAIKVDESLAFGLMYQCEKVINRFLKTLSGSVKFKIRFLAVSIFNKEEMLAKYKEALNYGMCKLEYMACLGLPQHDILSENYIETNILDLDNILTPLKTASTQSSDDRQAGRPAESDSEIDDAGVSTRDNDSNENR